MRAYAPRIRHLLLDQITRTRPILSVEILQGLQLVTQCVPGALSPNVVTLQWPLTVFEGLDANSVGLAASHIYLFAGKDLSSLLLPGGYYPPGTGREFPPLYQTSLSLTVEQLPGLKRLSINFNAFPSPTFTEHLLTNYPWENLEFLELEGLSRKTFSKLSFLPRLTNLQLWHPESIPLRYDLRTQPVTYLPPTVFPFLKNIILRNCDSISTATSLLQHLPLHNNLKTLDVHVYGVGAASFEGAQDLLVTIKLHCEPSTLTQLELDIYAGEGALQEGLELDVDQELDISPIFAFSRLRSLSILSHRRLRIASPQIAELASLSQLRSLSLWGSSSDTTTVPPSVGPEDIVQLVRGLPDLQWLQLRFDATQIKGNEVAPGGPFLQLQTLRPDTSPILSPSRVLAWLLANFPNLRYFKHGFNSFNLFHQRWDAVQNGIYARWR